MAVPADRYKPSRRTFPAELPTIAYEKDEIVRTVPASKDYVSFKGRLWKVPEAFRGERLAIRPLSPNGKYGIFFASYQVASIEL
jgi:putative transposase